MKTSQQHTMKKVGVQIQMGVCRSFSCLLLLLLCPVSPSTWPSLLLILHCVSTRHLIIHWKRKIRFATRVFLLNLHSRLGGAVQGKRGGREEGPLSHDLDTTAKQQRREHDQMQDLVVCLWLLLLVGATLLLLPGEQKGRQ